MSDHRTMQEQIIRRPFQRWKRWSGHLFATILINFVVWLVASLLPPAAMHSLFPGIRPDVILGSFTIITLIPLIAHYVHVRIANAEDKTIAGVWSGDNSASANHSESSHRLELTDDHHHYSPSYDDYEEKEKRKRHINN